MEKMSYNEAVVQLEEIVKKIEDPNVNLNEVEGLVKRAVELVGYCKGELKGYEEQFEKALDKE